MSIHKWHGWVEEVSSESLHISTFGPCRGVFLFKTWPDGTFQRLAEFDSEEAARTAMDMLDRLITDKEDAE